VVGGGVRPRGGALGTMRETNETLTHYLVLYMILLARRPLLPAGMVVVVTA